MDKFVLIYEYNNSSPLFAYVAEQYLKQNEPEHALTVLEHGLLKYPEYVTALVNYAITLAKLGENEEAVNQLKKARELFLDDKSYDYYSNIIRSYNDKNLPKSGNESLEPAAQEYPENKPAVFEDNLETLAGELEHAKVKPVETNQEVIDEYKRKYKNSNKKIVSETLAGIYFDQNNWKEALELYEELIKLRPKRKEIYKARIDEIKKRLKN